MLHIDPHAPAESVYDPTSHKLHIRVPARNESRLTDLAAAHLISSSAAMPMTMP
jgi:hypothetical protein